MMPAEAQVILGHQNLNSGSFWGRIGEKGLKEISGEMEIFSILLCAVVTFVTTC